MLLLVGYSSEPCVTKLGMFMTLFNIGVSLECYSSLSGWYLGFESLELLKGPFVGLEKVCKKGSSLLGCV